MEISYLLFSHFILNLGLNKLAEISMKFVLYTICAILSFASAAYGESSKYPMSREERQAEEMGSVLGGEGIVFRPSKIRHESTKTENSTFNKYLWDATIDVLSVAPLIVKDKNTGVISTDWYSEQANPNKSIKVTVRILDNVISPESLNIEIAQRSLAHGRWLEDKPDAIKASKIEEDILRKARDLYAKKL